ncbi:MAG TPA: LysE family translocator [Brevundimonas sp.]|jgi:threonine/homoserine/homoserine lactone efflux protein|uniref:LysE family translocator n=1 Tax=Brevundimonas sp. TaxID=1871086 RepID=UPI002DEE8970|nr:LysE family translocator [Brevundimonas sp.]
MELPVDPHRYATFLTVMAVMAVTPGPANLFSVANGMARGRAAALPAVLGMSAATLVWFGAAALGLGALVTAFPQVFRGVAWAGALYVAWLGVKSLWSGVRPLSAATPAAPAPRLGRGPFSDGFLVQIANPKAILFFTAVLPPFMDPARSAGPQLALFALATVGMDFVTMTAYGLGGAALARAMTKPTVRRAFDVVIGLLLMTAAALIGLR